MSRLADIDEVQEAFAREWYVTDRDLSPAVFLAESPRRWNGRPPSSRSAPITSSPTQSTGHSACC